MAWHSCQNGPALGGCPPVRIWWDWRTCEREGAGAGESVRVLRGERKAGHEPGNLCVCACVCV